MLKDLHDSKNVLFYMDRCRKLQLKANHSEAMKYDKMSSDFDIRMVLLVLIPPYE
jgi:hypothetical protein